MKEHRTEGVPVRRRNLGSARENLRRDVLERALFRDAGDERRWRQSRRSSSGQMNRSGVDVAVDAVDTMNVFEGLRDLPEQDSQWPARR